LIGSIVGVLTILLLVVIWAKDDRGWLKLLGVIALLAVIIQGVMGGLRVTHLSRALAIVHACFAQVFFGLTASLVLFTSRGWLKVWQRIEGTSASRLRRLSGITLVLIYVQFVFGAILRHTGTRLDAHLLFAALVTIHVFLLSGRVLRDYLGYLRLVRPVLVLSGLLAVQLVLGGAAYVAEFTSVGEVVSSSMSVIITTAHVAIGALMLVMSVVVTVSVYRLTSLDPTP
jgi:cytochrome c oxidase assembly protein subunit 15